MRSGFLSLEPPDHELRKKRKPQLPRQMLAGNQQTSTLSPGAQAMFRRRGESRRWSVITRFLKYQCLFLVDGNEGGEEATAAKAVF